MAWDPITQTGHTQGTPINWAQRIAAQTGTVRYASTTAEVNSIAQNTLNPGDVLLIRNGTYTGDWTFSRNGTLANPIIIAAENPGTFGSRNVIKSTGKIINNSAYSVVGAMKYTWPSAGTNSNLIQLNDTNIELTDMDVEDVTVTSGNPRCIVIDDLADFAYIHHCRFQNNYGYFFVAQDVTEPSPFGQGTIIRYCTFTNVLGYGGGNSGGQTVQIGNLIDDGPVVVGALLEYNKFTNCSQSQFKTSGNRLYRNYFANAPETAFNCRLGDDNVLEGNYFTACDRPLLIYGRRHSVINNVFKDTPGAYAIALSEGSLETQTNFSNYQHTRAEDVLIGNNVIIGSAQRGIHIGKTQTGGNGSSNPEPYSPIRITVQNNIISQSAGVAVFVQVPDTAPNSADGYPTAVSGYHQYVDCVYKNNDIYVTGTAVIGDNTSDGGTPTGYTNWNHATNTSGTVISGQVESNPNLSSTYRITGAPCQNAGAAYNVNGQNTATMVDWDANPRTHGSLPDIGVIEVASVVNSADRGHARGHARGMRRGHG